MLFKAVLLSLVYFVTLSHSISTDENDVVFYYYTSEDSRVAITYNDVGSLTSSNLLAATKTILVIDGFTSDDSTPMSQTIKNAFVNQPVVQNVILVDYGKLSGSGSTLPQLMNLGLLPATYLAAVNNINVVGSRVADFLQFLNVNKNIDFSNVHIAGHSLGAQVAGRAGYYSQVRYGQNVGRISGIDPAGPLFELDAPILNLNKLTKDNALFVDIYHTSAGTMGDIGNTGHMNVFVNGGSASQPGCAAADLPPAAVLPGMCSHYYSWKFFAASFTRNLNACNCVYILLPQLPLLSNCTCKTDCNSPCSSNSKAIVGVNAVSSTRGNFNFYLNDPLSS